MISGTEESEQVLQTLGFSNLEAAIYTYLLQQSPTTGYRIAHALGKPIANTYKSITALQAKGAVIVDEGQSRLCRAVPPDEIFGQMQHALKQRCEQAAEALIKLKTTADDTRVYSLHTWEQVMARARQMIERAEQVVLVNAFPHPLREIQAELENATLRGIGVVLKVYEPVDVRGADIVVSGESEYFLRQFPAQELSLVVDAQEHLQAIMEPADSRVIQAIWSSSTFLAFNTYNGLYSEWLLTRLNKQIENGASLPILQHSLVRSFPLMQTPGYNRLFERLESQDKPENPSPSKKAM